MQAAKKAKEAITHVLWLHSHPNEHEPGYGLCPIDGFPTIRLAVLKYGKRMPEGERSHLDSPPRCPPARPRHP